MIKRNKIVSKDTYSCLLAATVVRDVHLPEMFQFEGQVDED